MFAAQFRSAADLRPWHQQQERDWRDLSSGISGDKASPVPKDRPVRMRIWRPGGNFQVGQTAKARFGYPVQSLRTGRDRQCRTHVNNDPPLKVVTIARLMDSDVHTGAARAGGYIAIDATVKFKCVLY
jgi:hypothetical protein